VTIDLVKNPDLIAEIGVARTGGRRPVLVAFAVETDGGEALVASASRKLVEKRVDFVVANEADSSFGQDDNRATIVAAAAIEPLRTMPKSELADIILDRVRARLPS